MKPVLPRKRSYTYKDVFRFLGVILAHIFAFYAFAFFMLGIHFVVTQSPNFEIIINGNWFILYWITLAPIVSAFAHIYYSETGNLNVRLFVWMHTLLFILSTTFIVWVF